MRHSLPAIRAAACSRITGLWRTDASTRRRCTSTLVRVAVRATCPLHPGTAPPELLGGAVSGTGAVLVAAGGGERRHRHPGDGVPRTAVVPRIVPVSASAQIAPKTRPRPRLVRSTGRPKEPGRAIRAAAGSPSRAAAVCTSARRTSSCWECTYTLLRAVLPTPRHLPKGGCAVWHASQAARLGELHRPPSAQSEEIARMRTQRARQRCLLRGNDVT